MCPADWLLAADLGGTHVRFARVGKGGRPARTRAFAAADFPSLEAAIVAYVGGADPPREAAIAVAGPVHGDEVRLTNRDWSFSIPALRAALGLSRLEVLNDFEALALSLPGLGPGDTEEIRPGTARPERPSAVLGAGTGLGVAALVPTGHGFRALTTEGGHADLAAASAREWAVVAWLAERHGHASAERVLSGPGLVNLYRALADLDGREAPLGEAKAVVRGATEGVAGCAEAVRMFSAWMGAFAGDVALTFGALGGVFLGGGVVPKMGPTFDRGAFVERFLAKGRFADYLRPVPVRLIVHPAPALLGAARALETP